MASCRVGAVDVVAKRVGNGAGKGVGWGGPAKGQGAAPYAKGEPLRPKQGTGRTAEAVDAKADRIAMLTANLEHLALSAEREETRVSATIAALNRLEGLPIARQITAETNVERVLRIEIVDEPSEHAAPDGEAAAPGTGF